MTQWAVTPRQADVLTAIVQTGSLKGAARKLNISVKTVESHVDGAKRRAGSGTSLALFLMWHGLRVRGAPLPVAMKRNAKSGSECDAVLHQLATRGEGITAPDAAGILSITPRRASCRLLAMERQGLLSREGRYPFVYRAPKEKHGNEESPRSV